MTDDGEKLVAKINNNRNRTIVVPPGKLYHCKAGEMKIYIPIRNISASRKKRKKNKKRSIVHKQR